MPLFGGSHFSNPAVGRAHGMEEGGEAEHSEPAHSYHVFHHEDGTAHSHIHHASGEHEHTDHASHQEAHEHVAKAMGGETEQEEEMEGQQPPAEEKGEKHISMHNAARYSGGAF